uniref:uncharacterized protein LOC131105709 n=1 Tax=Doryrhamphus excisus TaxID=161450 RepID=UPI0025ADAB8B|nr:uncharacterized protein LOC131105709 [Doryrhamphus excisus]
MPVTFNNKSGTITADGCGLMDGSEYGDKCPRSVWWIGAAAVCLGLLYLLLLVIIIAMVAQYTRPASLNDPEQWPFGVTGYDNLTSCVQFQSKYIALLESNIQLDSQLRSLTKDKDDVTGERDILQKERNTLHSERDTLQIKQEHIEKERDALQKEHETLRSERDALKGEKESLQNDMDTLQNEKNTLKSERDWIQSEKETLQNERDTIMTERDSLRDERDYLKMVSSNLTKQLEVLQNRFNTVVETRDGLKEEAKELNQNRTEKVCPSDWVKFQEKCYYISKKGNTHSWQASRRDCKDRGGDLAIITTRQEENFITAYYDQLWIGLSDLDHEGKWKWVNGEELDFKGFWQKGEPNNSNGNEDCVEVSHTGGGWNDAPCRLQLSWVCEDYKSGVIRADGWGLMDSDYKPEHGDRLPRSVWWIGAAAVGLGLLYLLLVIIIAMVAQHIRSTPLKDAEQQLPDCDNLTTQCFQFQSKYNTLLESNKQLESKLCSLTKEKDAVSGQRDTLQSERDSLQSERDVLRKERNTLHSERDTLKYQRDTFRSERDTLQNEQEALEKERDTLKGEKESLQNDRDSLQKEKETLKGELDTLQNDGHTLQKEKEALKGERDTLQNEKETAKRERDILEGEKKSLQKDRDTLRSEKEILRSERDALKCEKENLQNERNTFRDERDHLQLVSSNLTKELEVLQSRFNTVVETRDGLKEEAKELNQDRKEKLCPSEWVKFQEKCYYISKQGNTKSWKASRRDCKDRGGDLAIITTREEENFITAYYDRIWIGLSDLDHEGKWKWVNGEELDFEGFWQKGEPNNSDGNEDCVEVSRAGRGWNDMPCGEQLSWVCED